MQCANDRTHPALRRLHVDRQCRELGLLLCLEVRQSLLFLSQTIRIGSLLCCHFEISAFVPLRSLNPRVGFYLSRLGCHIRSLLHSLNPRVGFYLSRLSCHICSVSWFDLAYCYRLFDCESSLCCV